MSFETPLPPYSASDPYATYLSASCLDFLLIEMVPMAYRLPGEIATLRHGHRQAQGERDASKPLEDEEKREAALHRLESLGHRVGQGLAERFSKDRPRFADTLDVIKFLCKDLWTLVFRKQIDNLKTNHRGVYVLTDNSFRPFSRMSLASPSEAVAQAQPFLWFPCGVIRGALARLGIDATVQAESSELPGATFQIKTVTAKA